MFVHFSNKCPNGANIRETHANIGTKDTSGDDIDGIIPTLEIDANYDYLFEVFAIVTNGSTKSYLEAALTTPTQSYRNVTSGRSAKAFHQNNQSIPTSYFLLDNQSTVDIFCKPTLLLNIRAYGRTLHISCITGTIPANQVSDLPGYGRVVSPQGYRQHPRSIQSR